MATYKGIQGYSVQKLSSDPTASEAAGQLFYNSGTGKFKIATEGAGAWATGGNAINSFAQRGGAGIQTSALAFGGNAPGTKDETEKYDGTSWTEVADLNTARRYVAGAGATNTAALAIGGYDTSPITSTHFRTYHAENGTGGSIQYRTGSDQANVAGYQVLQEWVGATDGSADDNGISGTLTIYDPSSAYVKHFVATTQSMYDTTSSYNGFTAGYINDTTPIDEINFKMSSGDIDAGTIYMYGVS